MIRTLILVFALVATACNPSGEAEQTGLLAIVDDLGDVVIVTADGDIVAEATDASSATISAASPPVIELRSVTISASPPPPGRG